jgi:uncharacterized protein
MMSFEWDQAKAMLVYRERAIAFEDIAELFSKLHVIVASDKHGEQRWRIVGELDDVCVTGVFTRRGDVIRIITARRSWPNEEREYRSLLARRDPTASGEK